MTDPEPRLTGDGGVRPRPIDPRVLAGLVLGATGPRRPLTLALDYDGTLVPLAPRPPDARADSTLRRLLAELRALPATAVAVVSGRRLEDLRSVLGPAEGVALFAEHGGLALIPPGPPIAVFSGDVAWIEGARSTLRGISWPEGTWIEEKTLAFALHTRGAREDRARAARERFRSELEGAGPAIRFLEGHEILEARPRGLHKGLAVQRLREHPWPRESLLVYAGDDRTDEDALRALEPGDVGIRVGVPGAESVAEYRLADPGAVRVFLEAILAGRREPSLGEVG